MRYAYYMCILVLIGSIYDSHHNSYYRSDLLKNAKLFHTCLDKVATEIAQTSYTLPSVNIIFAYMC